MVLTSPGRRFSSPVAPLGLDMGRLGDGDVLDLPGEPATRDWSTVETHQPLHAASVRGDFGFNPE